MAELHKRNTKTTQPTSTAAQRTPAPAFSKNLLYLVITVACALAIYYLRNPPSSSYQLQLTDSQLASYTGSDLEKPIYIALNGTVFDVSAGRSFYGPGGHYQHFAGRDATRAWVTACFEPEHLTWDMRGVEKMFLPKWMDEEIEDMAVSRGSDTIPDSLKEKAMEASGAVGKVSAKEKRRRRVEDAEEAERMIEEAMRHWVDFFRNNPKYKEVGRVVGREPLPEDRPDIGLCEDALKKRPVKGGKFEKMMGAAVKMEMGGQDSTKNKAPDFVWPGVP